MGESTAISWTHHTWNPWWGCTRVSPGCNHCYAETTAARWGNNIWGKGAPRRVMSDHYWNDPIRWDRAAARAGRPALVFCASMADVFEAVPQAMPMVDSHGELVPGRSVVGERRRLWQVIEATPNLRWQLLTKRPENVLGLVPPSWLDTHDLYEGGSRVPVRTLGGWPSNVWVGTTVEDQQRADERIPELLRIPAPVRFLSCEPLLGPVDLSLGYPFTSNCIEVPDLQWVIVGGESGPHHRPLDLGHARGLVAQAEAFGIPVFFKQVGGRTPTAGGHLLDGREIHQYPVAYELELCA